MNKVTIYDKIKEMSKSELAEFLRKVFDDDQEVMKTGKFIINKVERLTSVDGSEKWVSVTKFPRFDNDGNIIGTMGISRDITEIKKLEALQHPTI